MRKAIEFVVALLIVAFSVVFISGCNTVEGFGKDLEGTGQAIQDVAN